MAEADDTTPTQSAFRRGLTEGDRDEQRQRRSELARRMNQEVVDPDTGRRKFGGPQPGSGRPRKKRASEIVAEHAQSQASEIIRVFDDAIDPEQPISIRLQAARQILDIEQKEAALQLEEDKELAKKSSGDLIDEISESLAKLVNAGLIEINIPGVDLDLGPGDFTEEDPE